MKKLMVVLAAVAMAACGQAAQYAWQFQTANAKTSGMSAFNGKEVYLVLASDLAESYADVAALKAGAVNGNTPATLSIGNLKGIASGTVTGLDDSLINSTVSWYAVVVDGDNYFVSKSASTSTVVADNGTPTAGVYASTTELLTAGNWKAFTGSGPEPIPEPTSGLLVVLGIAGLALRRRA